MSTVFTADENGKVTPTVEPPPRISPELAAKIIDYDGTETLRKESEVDMIQEIYSHQFSDANGNPAGGQTFAPGLCVAWQNGPLGRGDDRKEPNGCFVETVINVAIDRLEFYQRSKFVSDYNAKAIELLKDAVDVLQSRTRDREARNIEGTHED